MTCETLATKADIQAIDAKLTAIQTKLDSLPDKTFIQELFDSLRSFLENQFQIIQEGIDYLKNSIREGFIELTRLSSENYQALLSAIQGIVATIVEAIRDILVSLMTGITLQQSR
ncbi:MAG: hypothetical protein ACRC2R_01655 [Xenococcaceae cyanobacterium]